MSHYRTGVYSTKQKLLLVQLVKKHSIVESKKTDCATLAEKNQAWESLTMTYNSQPEVDTQRTPQQLRKLWNNLKQRKRKETTAIRHDMLVTRRGPATVPNPSPVLEFISEAAGGVGVAVNCPADRKHLFERVGTCSTLEVEPTAEPQEVAVEVLFSDNSLEPVLSTSKGTSDDFFSGDSYATTEPTAHSFKGVATENGGLLSEEILKRNQQLEIFNLKKQILTEELLRVKEERARAAQRDEMDLQRATDQAALASLKLKQFRKKASESSLSSDENKYEVSPAAQMETQEQEEDNDTHAEPIEEQMNLHVESSIQQNRVPKFNKIKGKYVRPKPTMKPSSASFSTPSVGMVKILKSMYDQQIEMRNSVDEFDVYGELVARKLRNLSSRYAQITVQAMLNRIIYDAELGKYDTPKTSHEMALNDEYTNNCPNTSTFSDPCNENDNDATYPDSLLVPIKYESDDNFP